MLGLASVRKMSAEDCSECLQPTVRSNNPDNYLSDSAQIRSAPDKINILSELAAIELELVLH